MSDAIDEVRRGARNAWKPAVDALGITRPLSPEQLGLLAARHTVKFVMTETLRDAYTIASASLHRDQILQRLAERIAEVEAMQVWPPPGETA